MHPAHKMRGMMKRIIIRVDEIELIGELFDTPTAQGIEKLLPIQAVIATWGDEIYFTVTLHQSLEPYARQDVDMGDLGDWPEGPAFCIFFGLTPVSTSDKPRAYSPVNVFGRAFGNPKVLHSVKEGARIRVEFFPQ